jgi:hypothetical protein
MSISKVIISAIFTAQLTQGQALAASRNVCAVGDHAVIWRSSGFVGGLEAIVRAAIPDKPSRDPRTVGVEFVGAGCRTVYEIAMRGSGAVVRPINSGGRSFLLVTSEERGGSGSLLTHSLLEFGHGGLKQIALPVAQHSNMGGFFFGDLGRRDGLGTVIWDANWSDGAHYAPHPYTFRYYHLKGQKFILSREITTPGRYDPTSPDDAPEGLGLGFMDQSLEPAIPFAL